MRASYSHGSFCSRAAAAASSSSSTTRTRINSVAWLLRASALLIVDTAAARRRHRRRQIAAPACPVPIYKNWRRPAMLPASGGQLSPEFSHIKCYHYDHATYHRRRLSSDVLPLLSSTCCVHRKDETPDARRQSGVVHGVCVSSGDVDCSYKPAITITRTVDMWT